MERFEKTIPVKEYIERYIDTDMTFAACRKCENFGSKWSCPPFDFDPVLDFWERYGELTLVCYRMDLGDERDTITDEELTGLFFENKKLMDRDLAEMAEARPGSTILAAGSCDVCSRCARKDGLPCRMRGKMHYSIESLGGKVPETVHDLFGFDVLWMKDGKHPEYYILIGGLLTK